MIDQNPHMLRALELANEAFNNDEVPVGAVIVRGNEIIAEASNRVITDNDPTAHAEMLAIRTAAKKLGTTHLIDCDLYVTLEPCAMCAQAISWARLNRLYYGAADDKSGGITVGAKVYSHASCHHVPDIYDNIHANESALLLKEFFKRKR